MKGTSSMFIRTSIVTTVDETFPRPALEPVPTNDDDNSAPRWAMHIGWDFTVIATLEQFDDLIRRMQAELNYQTDRIADAAVADDDTVMEAIKND